MTHTSAAGFAANMLAGADLPLSIPLDRWDLELLQSPAEAQAGSSLRFASLLSDVASFDSRAFKMSASEAVGLDPQTRLLLEHVHGALQVFFLQSLYSISRPCQPQEIRKKKVEPAWFLAAPALRACFN